ncbi:TPA: PTS sugar transporter subunit IIA [Streptococcus pneumoniae]|nr:PTS sugar transporter subunit IIA [Streptococcus pneumoniae]
MKIQDLLRKDVMLLDLQATEKTAVIDEMIKNLTEHGYVTDFETFKEGILAREALTSTGLGDGIAMPHSKNAAVKEATVLFAKSNKGVDYESLDGQATDLFFMIAAPEGANDTHLAALVLAIKKYVKVPRSLEGAKSILLLPLFGTILTGFVMLAVNIPMAAINTAMNDFLGGLGGGSAVLLGIVLGGMMAVDMGGPVNKAAYVFGTGTLAATVSSGGSVAMAAVMAGGMVPPLAIFVATLLFKDKFTKEERNSGLTNIIMGLSFITEGAIPFGAADPARAIPSFILGSAVAGGLVGLTGIKLMAPHGGIFVIALTSNALLYLVSVLVGAIVSGVVYGYLRKPQA